MKKYNAPTKLASATDSSEASPDVKACMRYSGAKRSVCGYEDEYVTNFENQAVPRFCRGCGASVYVTSELDELAEAEILEEGEDRIVFREGEWVSVAVNIGDVLKYGEDYESWEDVQYAVFSKKVEKVTAEDVERLAKGVLIKQGAFEAEFEYVVKRPSRAGKGRAVYVPSEWGEGEVMLVRLHRESKESREE